MLRKWLGIVIACLVLQASNLAVAAPQDTGDVVDVRDRIRALPPGSTLEVKLTNEEKLKGKLGSVGPEAFELQISRKGTITARRVAFTEVRSIHQKRGMSTRAKILLGVGIFAGTAVVVTGLVLGGIGRN